MRRSLYEGGFLARRRRNPRPFWRPTYVIRAIPTAQKPRMVLMREDIPKESETFVAGILSRALMILRAI